MVVCDKCGEQIDVPVRGEPSTSKRGTRICDDCGLLLDRFIEQIDSVNDMQLWRIDGHGGFQ